MRPTCFVIMPYGGWAEERQRHYLGVYQTILAPAAERAGYTPKRFDLSSGTGNITAGIIQNLLESEMVIADLSDGNANVLFELGIRYAFRKSGTIHVINGDQNSPFDLHSYRVIAYSTDLHDIPRAVSAISQAIEERAQHLDLSDNPVHDALPDLPSFIMRRETEDTGLSPVFTRKLLRGGGGDDAFYLGPFSEPFDTIYRDHIAPTFTKRGFTVSRADEIFSTDVVMEDVWEGINSASLIVADLSGKNPNVMYEVGIAHTIGKPVLMISQSADDIPFNLRHRRCLMYAHTPAGCKKLEDGINRTIEYIRRGRAG